MKKQNYEQMFKEIDIYNIWHSAGKIGKITDRKCRADDLFLSRGCILECGNCGARDDANG